MQTTEIKPVLAKNETSIREESPLDRGPNRAQRRAMKRDSKRNMIRQVVDGKPVFHPKKFHASQYQSHTLLWRMLDKQKRTSHEKA